MSNYASFVTFFSKVFLLFALYLLMNIPDVGESQSHAKPIIIIIAPAPTMINELSNMPVAGTVGVHHKR